jgi:hypothetical protein
MVAIACDRLFNSLSRLRGCEVVPGLQRNVVKYGYNMEKRYRGDDGK